MSDAIQTKVPEGDKKVCQCPQWEKVYEALSNISYQIDEIHESLREEEEYDDEEEYQKISVPKKRDETKNGPSIQNTAWPTEPHLYTTPVLHFRGSRGPNSSIRSIDNNKTEVNIRPDSGSINPPA